MIFTQLCSYEDAFCLGLTSRYFWHVSRPYIEMFFITGPTRYIREELHYFGSWAGQKLICVNGATDSYPKTLGITRRYLGLPQNLLKFSEEGYSTAGWQSLPRPPRIKYSMLAALPEPVRSQAFDLTAKPLGNLTVKTFFPNDRIWILRNLTRHEYVRADKFAKSPDKIDGPHIKPFGFGEIILSRIIWSSHVLTNGINRGVWAGHCFDITTLDRLMEDGRDYIVSKNPEHWDDISEEVARDMDAIWSGLFDGMFY
ncbi:hypothetical protein K440DRAFT_668028 [Wilcoxina mikolae CBS 423.85]|nr:hypothetical protein K440DRAFT_668028 [Wilcoxina mikolae CBS 423.85]